MEDNQLPALLTIKKAAEVMGVSRDFMYKALEKNELPTIVIAGRRWIMRDQLAEKCGITKLYLTYQEKPKSEKPNEPDPRLDKVSALISESLQLLRQVLKSD